MQGTIEELLRREQAAAFVGRARELSSFDRLLADGAPLVGFVHGPAGIGKSALLGAFVRRSETGGRATVALDCGAVEPTPAGLCRALAAASGTHAERPVAEQLPEGSVLLLDRYERFRLLDTWLRQELVPSLRPDVRVVIASREPPVAAWWATPGWHDLVLRLPLGPLDDDAARELLAAFGVDRAHADEVNAVVRGHPLGLVVAGTASPGAALPSALDHVVEQLTTACLNDLEPATRRAVLAAGLVRRVTLPLLRAMLPDVDADDAYRRLRALPFVEASTDGLALHEAIQAVAASAFRAEDPEGRRTVLRAAWAQLRRELPDVGRGDLWRYTADMLWLVSNPAVREAFFPSSHQRVAVEPAVARDATAIAAIIDSHEAAPSILHAWWDQAPQTFNVVRGPGGTVIGIYVLAQPGDVSPALRHADVVVRRWFDDLDRAPVAGDQQVLLLRRWLDEAAGDEPSPSQGACWLDVKRRYMELRPALRRIYTMTTAPERYLDIVTTLGFRPVPEATVEIDGTAQVSVALDFGPGSVDGWLARLAAAEIGVGEGDLLDRAARQLVLGERRVDLTKLEHGVLELLLERAGCVVSRTELLAGVWGHDVTGSNVVDVVIRSLRAKLGEHAACIETVRGQGYRFRSAPTA